MNAWKKLAIWSLCLTTAPFAQGGEIVDRIVANVNGQVVLQSDWEEEIALEGLINQRAPDSSAFRCHPRWPACRPSAGDPQTLR